MQLDQHLRERAQHLARGAPVVDPGGLGPALPVHPAQDQLITDGNTGLVEHGARRVAGVEIEHRRHLALVGAAAHQLGPAAPAEHEAERVEQNRLARPGLAGQHVEARLELKLQPVDDQHVSNVEAAQHGGGVP